MFVLSNFLIALAEILDILIKIFYWLIIIRALISWVSPDPFNPLVQFLYKTTEPMLYPIRKIFPFSWRGGIDFSGIIAILLLIFIRSFLIKTILDFAYRIR